MATAVSRRGPDDRRAPVLAPSETGRIRGEAALPAHRAGGRIPVGGAGLRARLACVCGPATPGRGGDPLVHPQGPRYGARAEAADITRAIRGGKPVVADVRGGKVRL